MCATSINGTTIVIKVVNDLRCKSVVEGDYCVLNVFTEFRFEDSLEDQDQGTCTSLQVQRGWVL